MEGFKLLQLKDMCYNTVLIFLLVLKIVPQIALAGLLVKFLPGFEGPLPFELETGYIGVGEADEVQLHYFFIKSQSNPRVDPVIFWFTGGPGCSTLNAILTEFGPVKLDDIAYNGNLPTLSLNPYAYTKVASFLLVDLPVGTGFSYATTSEAKYSDNLQSADNAYQFLRKWLADHQEYLNNPFYIGGDSYSGITVPIITQVISDGIDLGIKPWIDLKGYILGNPVTFLPEENYYMIPFSHGMGLISDELYKSLKTNCGGVYKDNDPSNPPCSRDMSTYRGLMKDIYQYHILESRCDFTPYDPRRLLDDNFQKHNNHATKCREEWHELAVIWANDENVKEAFHVRKGTTGAWMKCNDNLPFATIINNTIPYHANLSSKGLRSLIYSGDHDLVVPFMSTEAWIKSLNYSIVDDWRQWIANDQVAGYTRSYSNQMTFATLKGAGHTTPEYKPMESFIMLSRWLSYAPL